MMNEGKAAIAAKAAKAAEAAKALAAHKSIRVQLAKAHQSAFNGFYNPARTITCLEI